MTEVSPPFLLELARSVGRDVRGTLAGDLGAQSLNDLVDEVYAFATKLAEEATASVPEARRRLPVCRAGCDSCCRVHAVFVTPAEALRIAAYLRATLDAVDLTRQRARIEDLAPRVAELSLEERAKARLPCPLLDEGTGQCTVHPVRPLLCRGYNSCDLGACLRMYESGDAGTPPPGNVEHAAVHKYVFAGLVLGAGRARDSGPLELIHAVRAALASPDVEARWLAGDAVFDFAETRIARERTPEWRAFVEGEAAT